MQCPKCRYEPTLSEQQASPDVCPKCSVVYAKVRAAAQKEEQPATPKEWRRISPAVRLCLALFAGLVIGYFSGREHVKHEIKSAFQGAFNDAHGALRGATAVLAGEPPETSKQSDTPELFTIKLLDKGLKENGYRTDLTLSIEIANDTSRDIKAFSGVLEFVDLLGDEILDIGLSVDDPISAGKTLNWSGGLSFNEYKASHKQFIGTDKGKMSARFTINKVLFADGELVTY